MFSILTPVTIFPSQFFILWFSAISLSLPQWGTENYRVLQSGNIKQKQPLCSYFHYYLSVRQKQSTCTVPDPCQWEHTFLPPLMATPSVFFGVSNYHSERWDRRQIFNRQAITGVNNAAPPSTNPGYCHRSHRSFIDTVKQTWNTFRRSRWLLPCLQNLDRIMLYGCYPTSARFLWGFYS